MGYPSLNLCHSEVTTRLKQIFSGCINSDMFPGCWKYANVQPIHKKDNYMPISLLPICGEILEKIVFDHVYAFLYVNKLLPKHQSGIRLNEMK